jgi:hypothetical protein
MSSAHVCDECKTVAPLYGAVGWWALVSIESLIEMGQKPEYHFCSWTCAVAYMNRHRRVAV